MKPAVRLQCKAPVNVAGVSGSGSVCVCVCPSTHSVFVENRLSLCFFFFCPLCNTCCFQIILQLYSSSHISSALHCVPVSVLYTFPGIYFSDGCISIFHIFTSVSAGQDVEGRGGGAGRDFKRREGPCETVVSMGSTALWDMQHTLHGTDLASGEQKGRLTGN